jgi:hypothetical protein
LQKAGKAFAHPGFKLNLLVCTKLHRAAIDIVLQIKSIGFAAGTCEPARIFEAMNNELADVVEGFGGGN